MEGNSQLITEEEAKLYDRQIRLWGLDAQNRMRNAKVLLIGLKGLHAEVCKNLVLAGIHSVTILEPEPVTAADLGAHLFISEEDVGKNRGAASKERIEELNPMVEVQVQSEHAKNKELEYFKQFNIVCASNCDLDTLIGIDSYCRKNGISFFCAETFGKFGYFFEDLDKFQYEKKIDGRSETRTSQFVSLEATLSVPWSKLPRRTPKIFLGLQMLYAFHRTYGRFPHPEESDAQKFEKIAREKALQQSLKEDSPVLTKEFLQELVSNGSTEISPVCAIIGGILAQEIIKVISANDDPFNNFFLYSGSLDLRQPGNVIKIE